MYNDTSDSPTAPGTISVTASNTGMRWSQRYRHAYRHGHDGQRQARSSSRGPRSTIGRQHDGTDVVQVQAWNGSAWQTLGTLGSTTANGTGTFSASLTAAQIGSHTQIRFVAGGNWDSGDNFYIDNVNIAYAKSTHSATFTEGGSAVGIATANSLIADPDNSNMESGNDRADEQAGGRRVPDRGHGGLRRLGRLGQRHRLRGDRQRLADHHHADRIGD